MPFEKSKETCDIPASERARDRSSYIFTVRIQNSESGIECEYPSECEKKPSHSS
jgi:hypothetical protein